MSSRRDTVSRGSEFGSSSRYTSRRESTSRGSEHPTSSRHSSRRPSDPRPSALPPPSSSDRALIPARSRRSSNADSRTSGYGSHLAPPSFSDRSTARPSSRRSSTADRHTSSYGTHLASPSSSASALSRASTSSRRSSTADRRTIAQHDRYFSRHSTIPEGSESDDLARCLTSGRGRSDIIRIECFDQWGNRVAGPDPRDYEPCPCGCMDGDVDRASSRHSSRGSYY